MKKVLLVAPLPPPYGGISHWTAMVIRHSQAAGRIPLQLVDIAPRHRSKFETSFVKRVIWGIPNLFRQLGQVVKALPSKNVIALHVITTGHYALVRDVGMLFLARVVRRRSVLHIRSGRVPALLSSISTESFAFRIALKIASHVIAIDKTTARAIRESLPSVPVSTVPNCIDLSALPEMPVRKMQTILFVGWVLPAKGIEELFGAWAEIARPDWRLRIIGPYSNEYAAHLEKNYNLGGVELVGECENSMVLEEMSRAAILCLPSHTEGFPNVVIEAMALGCAIVATTVGAIPEMLSDGAGMTVPIRDQNALADQLAALMSDRATRECVSARASAKAKREYSIDRVYQMYEKIWKGEDAD